MAMLLAFAPFIAFAVVDRLTGSAEGLFAGFAVSAAILMRDWLSSTRKPKLLEMGTATLFSALALYAIVFDPAWSVMGVRLIVDTGLFLIVVASIAIGQPFTLHYAREQASAEAVQSPEFFRTNRTISAVWALAFGVLIAADLVLIYLPDLHRLGIVVTVLALVGAFRFTARYPERQRSVVPLSVQTR